MTRTRKFIKQTQGAAAIIIAMALFALIGVASLTIDMGQLYTVRNQLQNVADAAALSGVGQLIQNEGGLAVWYTDQATAAALKVAQDQGVQDGLPTVADKDRDDLTIEFGVWNIYASNPSTAWDATATTTPNAMRVTITREAGKAFGPVISLFAQALGFPNSTVAANAIAYLGYTTSTAPEVPLALPGKILQTASNGRTGWFARLLGPREAVATTTKTLTFKDTGGINVAASVPTSPTANLDSSQGYFFTVGQSDDPNPTINAILTKIYNPSYTSSYPVRVGNLKVGQQLYPRSEYPWGKGWIGPIFENLQKAYYYKTTGNKSTAPAVGTAWHTTMAVHGLLSTASLPQKTGFMSLARLLAPFWASEAYACSTLTYPAIKVSTFVNVDVTGVTFNKSSCDDCTSYNPANNGVSYTSKKNCLETKTDSTWNANTVTVNNITDASSVSPPGSLSGGPANSFVNSNAPTNVGAYATIPRLVH